MNVNPSMTDEDWQWLALWRDAQSLSATEIESLEQQLQLDPSNLDIRVQLVAYFNEYEGNELKHEDAERKLLEQVAWLIVNKPSLTGFLGHRLAVTGCCFKPRKFATLRQAWLDQIAAAPSDGTILGNAASFIAWNDIEIASNLFERAYALQPTAGWLGKFVIFLNSELSSAPSFYSKKIREQIIDVGIRSLKSEPDGAPFLTCKYVADAAIDLGRFDVVRWCADFLRNLNDPRCEQMANAYLALVALRESDRDNHA